MTRRKTTGGQFLVTGPFEQDKPVETIGAGMSAGQTFASRHRDVEGEVTYYVRDEQDQVRALVTKQDDGVIVTRYNGAGVAA